MDRNDNASGAGAGAMANNISQNWTIHSKLGWIDGSAHCSYNATIAFLLVFSLSIFTEEDESHFLCCCFVISCIFRCAPVVHASMDFVSMKLCKTISTADCVCTSFHIHFTERGTFLRYAVHTKR